MDKTLREVAALQLDDSTKQVQKLADAFGTIERSTRAFAGPKDDYVGKRMPSKDWKKRQARKRTQKASRKKSRA